MRMENDAATETRNDRRQTRTAEKPDGETLHWDPAIEEFTNCDEGNQMLSRPRRKGYELPIIG